MPAAKTCILAEGPSGLKPRAEQEQTKVQRRLLWALSICAIFMVVELVGGFLANSLAIMTDAAHLLSDVTGFGVALFAGIVAARKSGCHHTFGYHRIEVLGALASVLSSWLVTGILVVNAVDRLIHPAFVNGKEMFALAVVGLLVNITNFLILGGHGHLSPCHAEHSHDHLHLEPTSLCASMPICESHDSDPCHAHTAEHSNAHRDGHRSINLQGAVLHIIGDVVQSIGVVIAGALIWWNQGSPAWQLADPICTCMFAVLVLLTTRAILIDIWDILMERVPRGISTSDIDQKLLQVEGVAEVHDLHIWTLKPGMPLLAAHITTGPKADNDEVLHAVTDVLRAAGIRHTTLQLVSAGRDCPCASAWARDRCVPDVACVHHGHDHVAQELAAIEEGFGVSGKHLLPLAQDRCVPHGACVHHDHEHGGQEPAAGQEGSVVSGRHCKHLPPWAQDRCLPLDACMHHDHDHGGQELAAIEEGHVVPGKLHAHDDDAQNPLLA